MHGEVAERRVLTGVSTCWCLSWAIASRWRACSSAFSSATAPYRASVAIDPRALLIGRLRAHAATNCPGSPVPGIGIARTDRPSAPNPTRAPSGVSSTRESSDATRPAIPRGRPDVWVTRTPDGDAVP